MESDLRKHMEEWFKLMLKEETWIDNIDSIYRFQEWGLIDSAKSCLIGAFWGMALCYWVDLHGQEDRESSVERTHEFNEMLRDKLFEFEKVILRLI